MAKLDFLRKQFRKAVGSPHSSFYRDLYADKIKLRDDFPATWDEWESIPILTRDDLLKVPFDKRIFIPPPDLYRYHQTSGTTERGLLILPRPFFPYHKELSKHLRIKSLMGFMYPHSAYEKFTPPGSLFIGGDPARLEASARLARSMRIDTIAAASAALVLEFAPVLGREYDLSRIRGILLQADVCTKLQRAALKRYFPRAEIVMLYVCAEMESAGVFSALPKVDGFPNAIESPPFAHFELLDESGALVRDTLVAGEMLVTVLYDDMALPLIRYRPGDRAQMIIRDDDRTVFTVLGRTGYRVKLGAGEILLDELERAIEAVVPDFVADFEARVEETESKSGTPRPFLSVCLIPVAGEHVLVPETLAGLLEKEIRVTENRTYADAVARGICAPLVCTVSPPDTGLAWQKRQRLVDARG